MKLRIIAVGNKMPAWVNAAFDEYAKRMPREAALELVEIKPATRAGSDNTDAIMRKEAERILAAIPPKCRKVVLDERGEQMSSAQLAEALAAWMREGGDTALIIGGADGLHPQIKAGAHRQLGLSKLTLPHALVRVLLAEQLYRAVSLLKNHPYHRE